MPVLRIQNGDRKGEVIGLLGERMTVGRAQGNSIKFGDGTVSRLHASLSRVGADYLLVDEGSTSGTFVNDQQITSTLLQLGDQIRFGGIVVCYESSVRPDIASAARPSPGRKRWRKIPVWLGCIAVVAAAAGFFAKPTLLRNALPGFRSLKPLGYFTTRSLPGFSSPISGHATISPREAHEVFLGIRVEVPSEWLLPTKEIFQEIQTHAEKADRSGGAGKAGSLEEWTVFDPNRFALARSDAREFKGVLIRRWEYSSMSGFASRQWERTVSSTEPNAGSPRSARGKSEQLAVVFALPEELAKPPFKVRYDDKEFVAVPAALLSLP